MGLRKIKVGSTEINHLTFLKKVAECAEAIILSTGTANFAEVEDAVSTIRASNPDIELAILQCTSEYPAPDNEMNVSVIGAYAEYFETTVGLSDHSIGFEASLLAIGFGATVIEKHFTYDTGACGPDHSASLAPADLIEFVKSIRRAEKMVGNSFKRRTLHEEDNLTAIRRSLVATRDLAEGAILDETMIGAKRPGYGYPPKDIASLLGKRLNRSLQEDEPFRQSDLDA